MAICYGCLQPFVEVVYLLEASGYPVVGEDDELQVEEPSVEVLNGVDVSPQSRFHVSIQGLFGYDIYLNRMEGAQLTIGCARDNNIVLPHTESKRHLLKLYYAQGQVWAEDTGSTQKVLVDNIPLTGTRCLQQGALLEIGEARIEFVER
jgi:hypothetical protein